MYVGWCAFRKNQGVVVLKRHQNALLARLAALTVKVPIVAITTVEVVVKTVNTTQQNQIGDVVLKVLLPKRVENHPKGRENDICCASVCVKNKMTILIFIVTIDMNN